MRTLPNRALTRAELRSIEPLLDAAVVTHVEATEYVELPQVTVVARANTGCDAVLTVVRDVGSYADFMPAIDTVEVRPDSDSAVGYDWTWQASVLSFRGTSTVSIIGEGDGADGFRAIFESLDGDLGRARRVLRATPTAEGCRLVLAGHQDMRDSNYLTREMAPSALTLSRTFSIVLSVATVTRLRGEAEHRAGVARPPAQEVLGDPRELAVDPAQLALLLARGDVFVLSTTDGTDLGGVVGLTRLAFTADRVRAAFFDPVRFTTGLLHGASITEVSREEHLARYRWGIDLPLIGSSGELTIRDVSANEVELEATEGAMRGGRIVLTTGADGDATYATMAARLDPSDGVPIIRAIESTDPAFRPGLVASGILMAFRGLRRGLNEGH